ncbi:hypothetical protein GYMLUDRAFT_53981 [Collybiopsis luxurians FD-317 M1]|nr:hypothetical protein GYMLUDRAFT_53981 [Collybiopsis luxurians FD-317 M1]
MPASPEHYNGEIGILNTEWPYRSTAPSNTSQPSGTPGMKIPPPGEKKESTMHKLAEKAIDKAAEKGADEAVDYVTNNAQVQQTMQNAEDTAKGWFNKYCGCLGSAS